MVYFLCDKCGSRFTRAKGVITVRIEGDLIASVLPSTGDAGARLDGTGEEIGYSIAYLTCPYCNENIPVRHGYSCEWCKKDIDVPAIVCFFDGVLCDSCADKASCANCDEPCVYRRGKR